MSEVPTWSEILSEIHKSSTPAYDTQRRKYLRELSDYTDRNTILYSSSWIQNKPNVSASLLSIVEEDMEAFMEVVHGLKGDELDLILHSPGGSAESADAIVQYLRSKFKDIRVIIPHAAMSAATMLSCSANKIVMGKHSFLGPIDPQFIFSTGDSSSAVAAQAIIDQFDMAREEISKDPNKVGVWMPILSAYAPALYQQAKDEIELAKSLVSKWLHDYMFKGSTKRDEKSAEIGDWLGDHHEFKSHGIHIGRNLAKKHGMRVEYLEKDQKFQDLVLSVFHSMSITFTDTNAAKIVENQNGKAFIKTVIVPTGPSK